MLHVLFVCTGNTCRSPMAMAIYEKKSREYGISSIFSSAALGFINESGAAKNAVIVCDEIGVDLSRHKPRPFRERDLRVCDIFVVMTSVHAETLMSIGVPKEKIFILGGGIPDPYGSDIATYRQCRNAIEEAVDEFCRIVKKKLENGTLKVNDNDKPDNNTNGAGTP